MTDRMIAPFYKLGQHVAFTVLNSACGEKITGEVMATDTGWIAIKDEADGEVRWYNLDHIIHITVLGWDKHD